jgi:hypothetical protein
MMQNVPEALTADQVVLLRIARGDRLPPSPHARPQTIVRDRMLLSVLKLLQSKGRTWLITARGNDYLDRVDRGMRIDSNDQR